MAEFFKQIVSFIAFIVCFLSVLIHKRTYSQNLPGFATKHYCSLFTQLRLHGYLLVKNMVFFPVFETKPASLGQAGGFRLVLPRRRVFAGPAPADSQAGFF